MRLCLVCANMLDWTKGFVLTGLGVFYLFHTIVVRKRWLMGGLTTSALEGIPIIGLFTFYEKIEQP